MERLKQIWDSYKEIVPAIQLRTSVNVDQNIVDALAHLVPQTQVIIEWADFY